MNAAMERGSDKHGPRLDEALEHETQGLVRGGHDTHAEEWKSAEPSGEDQPDVDLAPDGTLVGGAPAGMSEADVEGRSEVATYLHPHAFPAVRAMLLDEAERNQAPESILKRLRELPAGREFANVGDVWRAVRGSTESARF
jgi:hypothetical protein